MKLKKYLTLIVAPLLVGSVFISYAMPSIQNTTGYPMHPSYSDKTKTLKIKFENGSNITFKGVNASFAYKCYKNSTNGISCSHTNKG